MGRFGRSWELTKLSFEVVRQDSEMLLFPLLAAFFSLLYAGALLVPSVLTKVIAIGEHHASIRAGLGILDYLLVYVAYVGLAFISTFFNVCVVFTTKTRFEGGDATFGDSIRFAFSRVHLIFSWSLVSASVGLLLHALEQAAHRGGLIGEIILRIIRGAIGVLWSVVTVFVVPAMVYKNVGPVDAIKDSINTLKSTWGESLIRHFGLGLIQMLLFVAGIAMAVVLFAVLGQAGGTGLVIAIAVTVVYFIGVILVFAVANSVFNTALYAYANGTTPPHYDSNVLAGAFGPKAARS